MGLLTNLFSSKKSRATSLYKRGLKRAKERDLAGAIDDYTAVMDMEGAPPDICAMSQFNRALAHSTARNYESAKADLDAVLASQAVPAEVREAARQKLQRMQRRMGKAEEDE